MRLRSRDATDRNAVIPRYLLGVTVFRQDMQCRKPAGSGMMFAPS